MRHFVLSGGDFLFLEDFFPGPIAMCKILLYVESTPLYNFFIKKYRTGLSDV